MIVSGSCYVRKFDGLYNVCYVYDNDGQLSGEYEKHKLKYTYQREFNGGEVTRSQLLQWGAGWANGNAN